MDSIRRGVACLVIVLGGLAYCVSLFAQEAAPTVVAGQVEQVATREGVSVPIYTYWHAAAVATVVLFSGGAGGYGQIGADGWPTSGNFLIRTGKHWASYPFNIVMVGRPSDGIDLSLGAVRIGKLHAADNTAIFKAIKGKSPAPIWVVGTSMGTISAAAATIACPCGERASSGPARSSQLSGYWRALKPIVGISMPFSASCCVALPAAWVQASRDRGGRPPAHLLDDPGSPFAQSPGRAFLGVLDEIEAGGLATLRERLH